MTHAVRILSIVALGLGVTACTPSSQSAENGPAPVHGYTVVNVYPHDPGAFTQGLLYHEGTLFEGTGIRGASDIREVELESGDVIRKREIADRYFGEGIALWGDTLIQLTWQSNVGFVYERASFERVDDFSYPTEGWGLTHDGERLIMSDGTSSLYFLDPETFDRRGRVTVRDDGEPIDQLNELEFIDGRVYANVWQTDRIAIVDPQNGHVDAWIDLSGLLAPEDRTPRTDVLNGIAHDPEGDRLFVTGKYWPKLFEIDVVR
jgi:glutamine cyclotransferase